MASKVFAANWFAVEAAIAGAVEATFCNGFRIGPGWFTEGGWLRFWIRLWNIGSVRTAF